MPCFFFRENSKHLKLLSGSYFHSSKGALVHRPGFWQKLSGQSESGPGTFDKITHGKDPRSRVIFRLRSDECGMDVSTTMRLVLISLCHR